jgi:DNA-binding transcriptional regulator YiaG
LVKYADIDVRGRRANNLDMMIVEITGGMLRAARSLTGLSQQELAERASISRPCLTAWEGSSGSVPNAKARALHRVVAALEAEGIRFSDGGVHLQRPAPSAGTVLHSEGAAA